jgi:hypothetical protein
MDVYLLYKIKDLHGTIKIYKTLLCSHTSFSTHIFVRLGHSRSWDRSSSLGSWLEGGGRDGAGRARGWSTAAAVTDGLRRDLEPTQAQRVTTLHQDLNQLKKII